MGCQRSRSESEVRVQSDTRRGGGEAGGRSAKRRLARRSSTLSDRMGRDWAAGIRTDDRSTVTSDINASQPMSVGSITAGLIVSTDSICRYVWTRLEAVCVKVNSDLCCMGAGIVMTSLPSLRTLGTIQVQHGPVVCCQPFIEHNVDLLLESPQ